MPSSTSLKGIATVSDAPHVLPQSGKHLLSAANRRPTKVLIAEDQAALRHWLSNLLAKWGYDVVVVEDGEAAWHALQAENAPQLVILDWLMPKMEGPDLCRAIRNNPRITYTYILMLTGKDRREDIVRGLEAGADDYIVKRGSPDNSDLAELEARLNTGRRIVQLQNELMASYKALERANVELQIQATHDGLTSLWNRGAILELLERGLAESRRDNKPFGLLLADMDHFKKVNDTFGHMAGDTVLRSAARRMQDVLRPSDKIGRYGGEEFLVMLPGCGLSSLMPLAERLRTAVCESPIEVVGEALTMTISIGGSSREVSSSSSLDALLHAADEALYLAKDDGRNCVRLGTAAS